MGRRDGQAEATSMLTCTSAFSHCSLVLSRWIMLGRLATGIAMTANGRERQGKARPHSASQQVSFPLQSCSRSRSFQSNGKNICLLLL